MAISVLTFNVRKFDVPGVSPDTIIEQIKAQKADVMLFQEVFNTRIPGFTFNVRKLLRRALEPAGWRVFWAKASGALGFSDGLMVALRGATFDLDDTVFVPQRDVVSTELSGGWFGRVALGVAALPRGEDRPWLFTNTHLTHGQTNAKSIEKRRQQVKALLPFLAETEKNLRPSVVVLGGDFNAHGEANPAGPQSEVIRELLAGDLRDAYRELHDFGENPGFTFDWKTNALLDKETKREDSARYDYLFFRPTDGSVRVTEAEVVLKKDPATGFPLSDHYGVRAVFEVAG